jgi:hypothetical protein
MFISLRRALISLRQVFISLRPASISLRAPRSLQRVRRRRQKRRSYNVSGKDAPKQLKLLDRAPRPRVSPYPLAAGLGSVHVKVVDEHHPRAGCLAGGDEIAEGFRPNLAPDPAHIRKANCDHDLVRAPRRVDDARGRARRRARIVRPSGDRLARGAAPRRPRGLRPRVASSSRVRTDPSRKS